MFRRSPAVASRSVCWAIIALLTASPVVSAPAGAQGAAPRAAQAQPPSKTSAATVTLDFANAEIDAVARTLATITGRNVVVDPRVKGTMTLASTAPVTPDEALRLFSAQLRAQGYALVDSQGIYVVVPEADAKLQAASVSSGRIGAGGPVKGGGQIQTQIFRLTHENANSLVPVLRPLISPNNTINVDANANALVITDYGDNLQRIARIIASLDVSNATGVEIVRLHYAVASDLAPLVAKLLEPGGGTPSANPAATQPAPGQPGNAAPASVVGGGDGYRTTLIPEPRSNAIIVRAANPARLAMAKSLIQQLDQPADTREGGSESGNIHVVYLKNADATRLAVTLRAALAALPQNSNSQNAGVSAAGVGGAGGGNAANTSQPMSQTSATATGSGSSSMGLNSGPAINAAAGNQPNTGGQIQADPATNSLIISAPEPVYRDLRAVIDKLDQRRAQVYIESLVAEVNTNKEADLGIQWQGLLGNGRSTYGVVGTNYSTGGNTNIFNFAAQFAGMKGNSNWTPTVAPSNGFNLIFGSGLLGVLANFIQSSGTGNVLSTPTLLTLDNEEARIMVGQNVPIVTGSYVNTGASSTSSVNPFQTYDRQDVGITLRVRPQISEDGSIKLVIYQEVSSIVASTVNSASGPTTSKRAIESSVIVNDGQIIALGGLLQDEVDASEDKVPLLGDLPVLGNLFKSQSRTHTKSNLMVFLRPVIVRDAAATENYSLDRYEYMRALQQGTQPSSGGALDVGSAPVMPPAAPVNPQTASRPAPPAPLVQTIPGTTRAPAAARSAPNASPTSSNLIDSTGQPVKIGQ